MHGRAVLLRPEAYRVTGEGVDPVGRRRRHLIDRRDAQRSRNCRRLVAARQNRTGDLGPDRTVSGDLRVADDLGPSRETVCEAVNNPDLTSFRSSDVQVIHRVTIDARDLDAIGGYRDRGPRIAIVRKQDPTVGIRLRIRLGARREHVVRIEAPNVEQSMN